MNRSTLIRVIRERKNFLCVGLDPDIDRMPVHVKTGENPIFEFNKAIIDATRDHCVAYKPNTAFYECHGSQGWDALEQTVKYIGKDHLIIADAKRGDIGNTSRKYAQTFFETLDCDAITVAPYMGSDSVQPFIEFPDKWVIILALTSNLGASDFQFTEGLEGMMLYERVLKTTSQWGSPDNLMYVVGATRPEMFLRTREIVPDHFLLVPGVGAQGGKLEEVCQYGMNSDVGLLINASRSILYASDGTDYAKAAGAEARRMSLEMKSILQKKNVL